MQYVAAVLCVEALAGIEVANRGDVALPVNRNGGTRIGTSHSEHCPYNTGDIRAGSSPLNVIPHLAYTRAALNKEGAWVRRWRPWPRSELSERRIADNDLPESECRVCGSVDRRSSSRVWRRKNYPASTAATGRNFNRRTAHSRSRRASRGGYERRWHGRTLATGGNRQYASREVWRTSARRSSYAWERSRARATNDQRRKGSYCAAVRSGRRGRSRPGSTVSY